MCIGESTKSNRSLRTEMEFEKVVVELVEKYNK